MHYPEGLTPELTGRASCPAPVAQDRATPPERRGHDISGKGAYAMDSSPRSMTATTGRAVLAIIAILSLLLSAFAIARPAIAAHDDGTPEVTPTTEAFPGGDATCADPDATAVRIGNGPPDDDAVLAEGTELDVTLSDGSTATLTIVSLDNNELTFEIENGLAAVVRIKGGSGNQDGHDVNIYDYSALPGGGIAHDDGLATPTGHGISHVDFCLVPVEASILVHKTDQTEADVAGAEFTVHDGATVVGGPAETNADGLVCFDGLALDKDYTVAETSAPDGYVGDPDSRTVAASLGNCEDRIADGDAADATFTNTLLGSLLVHKTDDQGAALDDAGFTVRDGEDSVVGTFASGDDGAGLFCIDGLVYGATYEVTEDDAPEGYVEDTTNPRSHVIDSAEHCEARLSAEPIDPDLTFVNTPEQGEEPSGSITIDKQLEECETCEAYTPGYWFNRGGGGGVDWANDWLGANPQAIAGIGTFDSVASVQAELDADTAGDDGDKGLSATGQLLRHYLALVLNVAFAETNDCDLAALTYGDRTIAEWLDAALAALEIDASDDDKREIKDALDAINNSDAGDGTLECGGTEAGAHAGVTFELYDADDELVDSGTTGADGSLVLDGDPDGAGLPLGTYTLVEVSNDEGLECTIVSVSGDGTTLNEDGTVTIVLTEENADVAITVVNDCEEQAAEEDEFGHISVMKETDEEEATESFSFTATWDSDGFSLMDGDLEPSGDLLAGVDYTVTEVLSPAQVAAGWSLDDIGCTGAATWSVAGDGMSVTITLGADEDVVCTFTNELEDQPQNGLVEVDKLFCITSGGADTEFFVFDPVLPDALETQGAVADEQLDEGCWSEDVAFTITGGDLEEPMHVSTGEDGILEVELPVSENAYVITEDLSGESDEFWVEEGAVTVILVINWIPDEAGTGTVKVIKLFCETDDAAEAGVEFQVEGEDVAVPVLQDCTVGDATFEFGDDTFSVGADGLAIFTAEVGEYDFAEIAPNAAVYSGTVPVVEGEFTTVIVLDTFVEDELAGGGGGGGGGGTTPGHGQTPREGTAGGNPLPDTATTPARGGSLPAILLALMALGALAVGGQRMAAEARSRR